MKEAEVRELLEEIDRKAEAGLCYFTLGSAREFLKDIRTAVAEALAAPTIVDVPRHDGTISRYDLSPAMVEGKVRDALIALGWTPPPDRPAVKFIDRRAPSPTFRNCTAGLPGGEPCAMPKGHSGPCMKNMRGRRL